MVFLRLAADIMAREEVETRWQQMIEAEARIIQNQPPGPRMHSGVPGVRQ